MNLPAPGPPPTTAGSPAGAPVPDPAGGPIPTPGGGSRWRGTFAALRHRNFRLFFWGQFVSLIGTWMDKTAEGWLVYQLTGSKILLGVIAAAGTAPMLLFSVWGGSLADRHPKRSILVWTQAISM